MLFCALLPIILSHFPYFWQVMGLSGPIAHRKYVAGPKTGTALPGSYNEMILPGIGKFKLFL
jgi:hypothetical protein